MLQSTNKISKLIGACKDLDMMALALTDTNNMFGCLEFCVAATKSGIQPICGIISDILQDDTIGQLLLLAKDEIGFKNLLYLASAPYIKYKSKDKPYITYSDLYEHNSGLIALSGYHMGHIGKNILTNPQKAKRQTQELIEVFGDRFYFEIMRHGLAQEQAIESEYLNLAEELEVPIVATNQVLFDSIASFDVHDIMLCIAQGAKRYDTNRVSSHNQYYLKSQDEMRSLFADLPDAILNTLYIAQRCHYIAQTSEPMLPNFTSPDMQEQMFRTMAIEGFKARMQKKFSVEGFSETTEKEYTERLNYELKVICGMQFVGYFLIVADFISWSKKNGIAVGPGRGSGAGSIVAWSLGITDIDPIMFGLLFERFLNPERVSMPDFDIDFCKKRRDEVIKYVADKYKQVAHIITFGSMQAKGVIKDVGRVLGLRYKYADYLTNLVPFNAVNPVTLEQAIEEVEELKNVHSGNGLYSSIADDLSQDDLIALNNLMRDVLNIALQLEGLYRHCSIHAAGVVIGNRDLLDILPLYADQGLDLYITQYSMKYAEMVGLVKFDFLGLQTLTVISECIELLAKDGINIDLSMPLDDQKVYEMLSEGRSIGVFQFESIGIKNTLKKLKPDCIQDLMALTALYRPGPMDQITTYINCKHKIQQPHYLHPMLESILSSTYGVIVYQEQVLEIARKLAGYSLGGADLLRKAIGKKIKSEMQAQQELFLTGCVNNKIKIEDAKEIFALIEKFAGYGFNKAHAASYGLISYHTAYLKAHYLTHFLLAYLNLEMNDHDKINMFLYEARRSNIEVLPPDINQSEGRFITKGNNTIIFALGCIKGVTVAFGDAVVEARKSGGKFVSIIDFLNRIPSSLLNKKVMDSMIKSGCFDDLNPNRRQLEESVHNMLAYNSRQFDVMGSRQLSLIQESEEDLMVKTHDWDFKTKSMNELEAMGTFCKFHPLLEYKDLSQGMANSKTLQSLHDGTHSVRFMGVIQNKFTKMSPRGRFVVLQVSDLYDLIDVSIFDEELLKSATDLLEVGCINTFICNVQRDQGTMRIMCKDIRAVNYSSQIKHQIVLQADNSDILDQILLFLENKRSDTFNANSTVMIEVKHSTGLMYRIGYEQDAFLLTFDDVCFLKRFMRPES